MKKSTPMLSKSRVVSGLQCEKLLWLSLNKSDLAREISVADQALFDTGHQVGEEAQRRFPGGLLIDVPYYDRNGAISQTNEAIERGVKTLYEATVEHNGIWAKIDILNKIRAGWDLIEVKSTTSVKEQHLWDVAVQAYAFMHSGLPLNKCYLMHLNNQCYFPDLESLFTLEDITDEVEQLIPEIEKEIKRLKKVTTADIEPVVSIGPHCTEPYSCPYIDHCWKRFPEKNIFQLPRIGAKGWDLFDQGFKKIVDLNSDDFTGAAKRAIEVTQSKKRFVDKEAIAMELESWRYPLHFFDFETIAPAIPRYKNTKPYSAIPFQYSCHVMQTKDSKTLGHFEYLHTSSGDPRAALAKSLVDNFGAKGSVVAYNMSFEKKVLLSLAEQFPKYKRRLLDIASRLVDPLPIFRNHVYDPEFLGSFSIKYVAPAIVGDKLKYDDLQVSEGTAAAAVVNQLMTNQITDKAEREKLTQALLDYCRQDTLAMIELVKWLYSGKLI